MKKKALGYYDYTVILTYCGMLFAFFGILKAIEHGFWEAAFCLMFAGICDMFDGAVASTKERTEPEKVFGIQIDSLSDLISFGVLPGVFAFMFSGETTLAAVSASFFVLCALIRLAYFNVLEEERQRQTAEKRKSYLGVPVTTIALILPLFYMLCDYKQFNSGNTFSVMLILMGVGFLAPVEIKKPGNCGKVIMILFGLLEVFFMIMGRRVL